MLKHLSYEVTFPSTGRKLSADVDFHRGLGAITGPNESGKSMIVEMIRYCLFGSAALRGKATDYKGLKAELAWDSYLVKRHGAKSLLFKDGTEVAVGTKPVNAKIVEELGFGLDVFDTACVANQSDLERLTSMRPAERKRMVDSVIGVSVIEDLGRWAGDEVKMERARAEALEEALGPAPVEPEIPANYRPSSDIAEDLKALQAKAAEAAELRGWLSSERTEPTAPLAPTKTPTEIVRVEAERQAEVNQRRRYLSAELANIPEPSPYSDEQIAEFEKAMELEDWLNKNPVPEFTEEELDEAEKAWELIGQFSRLEKLRAAYDRLTPDQQCPACGYRFHGDQTYEQELLAEIEALMRSLRGTQQPDEPRFNQADVPALRRYVQTWEIPEHLRDAPDCKPEFTRAQLNQWRLANMKAARRAEIVEELEKLPTFDRDWVSLYDQCRRYEDALEAYKKEVQAYREWQAQRSLKQAQLSKLETEIAHIAEVEVQYHAAIQYERELDAFQKQAKEHKSRAEQVEHHRTEAKEWEKVKRAMTVLRGLIKQHLVPSLNKVASHLLAKMTGGQRQQVVVDEEFEIMVDGQPVDTLSGSGKAVVNLALRIALGQVLTKNVMSLFIGDEIDASMDQLRAGKTTETLRTLVDSLSQILIVTHKSPSADYTIELGGVDAE